MKSKLSSFDQSDVFWTNGFWADRYQLCKEVMMPEIRKSLDNLNNGAVFRNFCFAAGHEEGEHVGTNWSDGDCYKWMETVCYLYQNEQQEKWKD
ncbi:MAG: glycoside hydrolase family 127 protein, partial [Candidatus Latescibacteria bacterium]|nr:glycoside hydrolase family 127 protein [Candidatus Latescibacterota bacterium]